MELREIAKGEWVPALDNAKELEVAVVGFECMRDGWMMLLQWQSSCTTEWRSHEGGLLGYSVF